MPKGITIKTSKKQYVWTIQRKQGGRWRTLIDSSGPIIVSTRKLARDLSRQYKNLTNKPRSFRVKKLT
jgi:hypothetical protein